MQSINKAIKIGTLVKLDIDDNKWYTVKELYGGLHERNHIKVKELCGSFQNGHIIKFTNKKEGK